MRARNAGTNPAFLALLHSIRFRTGGSSPSSEKPFPIMRLRKPAQMFHDIRVPVDERRQLSTGKFGADSAERNPMRFRAGMHPALTRILPFRNAAVRLNAPRAQAAMLLRAVITALSAGGNPFDIQFAPPFRPEARRRAASPGTCGGGKRRGSPSGNPASSPFPPGHGKRPRRRPRPARIARHSRPAAPAFRLGLRLTASSASRSGSASASAGSNITHLPS